MKTRYIIAIAAAALALAGCQRESLVPELGTPYDGIVKFAPGVAGIGSGSAVGVRSGLTDGSAVIGSESLTLRSADGRFTIPMTLTVTGTQAAGATSGAPTKSTLINEKGGITASDFATAISNTFWVAAWSNDATPVQIIPDAYARDEDEDGNPEDHGFLAGGYVSANKEYQKVVYRTKGVAGNDLTTPYWMTMQPGSAAPADDEYKWKKNEAEKTFYAYANVPVSATMAQLNDEGTLKQTLTCTGVPTQDILMGYYRGDGSTGDPEKQTGTARIQFHHPLAAVKFKTGTLASGVTISGVAIEKIYGKVGEGDAGKLMVTQKGHSFTWTRADGDAFKEENLLPEVVATCDGEAALVIPQSFPSDSKARIRVTLQQDGETFNVYTSLSGSWSAGYVYTYTIEYNPPSEDLLPGKFSVSATEYVQFSKGNLQFKAGDGSKASPEWRFAEHQYDHIINTPGNTTAAASRATQSAWIDLFGWGATGRTDINSNLAQPYESDKDNSKYKTRASVAVNETLTRENGGDWGVCMGEGWYTLSNAEWQYLFGNSAERKDKYKYGVTVCGIEECLIIVPDVLDGYTFDKSKTSYTAEDWATAEAAGLVCLPPSGWRGGSTVNVVHHGHYWSSSAHGSDTWYAFFMWFDDKEIDVGGMYDNRYEGRSVRLVQKFPKPHGAVLIGDLYWATENLAVTAFGMNEWKGTNNSHPTGHVRGDYFKWGATDVLYSDYDGTQFILLNDNEDFSNNLPKYELANGNLKPEYDAATVNWGDGWRIPTAEELAALVNATFWAFDLDDDLGYYVFNPTETYKAGGKGQLKDTNLSKENAILFFPFTGTANGISIVLSLEGIGPFAHYFSSTFKEGTQVKTMDISWGNIRAWQKTDSGCYGYNDGFHGCVIRPVKTAPAD